MLLLTSYSVHMVPSNVGNAYYQVDSTNEHGCLISEAWPATDHRRTDLKQQQKRVKTRSWGFRGTTWLFRGGVNRAHEGLDTRKNPPRWGRNFFLYQSPPDALPAALPAALPPASCTAGCVCLPHTSSLFSRVASGPAVELVRSSFHYKTHVTRNIFGILLRLEKTPKAWRGTSVSLLRLQKTKDTIGLINVRTPSGLSSSKQSLYHFPFSASALRFFHNFVRAFS